MDFKERTAHASSDCAYAQADLCMNTLFMPESRFTHEVIGINKPISASNLQHEILIAHHPNWKALQLIGI